MKKIKNVFMMLLTFVLAICGISEVNASTYNGRLYEEFWQSSGVGVFASDVTSGGMDYNGWMIKSTADNRIYYCIQPEIALEGAISGSHNYVTGKENIISSSRLNATTYKRVQLLAYYGYGYKDNNVNHRSKKWYGITQVMIWRTVRTNINWTFKDARYGSVNSNLYKNEVAEMESLVSNHLKTPSFSSKNLKLILDDTIELNDTNGVLSNYNVVGNTNNVKLSKSGNKLKITATKLGKSTITFEKVSRTTQDFALLYSTSYQDVIAMGKADPAKFSIDIEVIGGTINLQKIDGTTEKAIARGEATLKGAVYGVYDTNNNLVGKITTDDKGAGKLSLNYGKYIIKEITAPKGYKLSDKTYEVELTKENDNIDLQVSDDVITGKVLLTKKKGGTGEEFVVEANATFDIIDSTGKVVERLTTNEKGMSIVVLPYGEYTIHQTGGAEGYVFNEDFKVQLYEEKIYEFDLKNVKPSKLIFTKVDFSTGKPLPNTKIEIYTDSDELIFSGVTDENGRIEIENLKIGKYYILEKEAPKYYRINEEKMFFEVKENGTIIKSTMKDQRKEGNLEFTKTDASGEKFLPDTLIEIYFQETNEMVFKNRTDENGKIKIEGLIAGKYCLYEKEAPKGYELDPNPICFEIVEENETIKIDMVNDEIVEVPDTSTKDSNVINIIGGIAVVCGLGYIIYDKKKKK